MSKHNRNRPAFPAATAVIDAPESLEPNEVERLEALLEKTDGQDGTVAEDETFSPTPVETLNEANEGIITPPLVAISSPESVQDDLAAHITAMLAESGGTMTPTTPQNEPESDLGAELDAVMGAETVKLPDGSLRVPIVVPEEMVEVLRTWADGAGEPFDGYLQKMVEMGLLAIVLGGAVAG